MDVSSWFDWGVALLTLTSLELVLGIDNIVLLSILVEKLPEEQQHKARRLGLSLALVFRILLLSGISWIMKLQEPLFSLNSHDFSLRDVILFTGGLFLLAKATTEIYHFTEAKHNAATHQAQHTAHGFALVIGQIIAFDMIFSLDSVLTAVGLTSHISIMIIAVVVSAVLMIIFAKRISDFVQQNPALKMLALSFLAMIGVLLVAEGFGSHFDKGYIYFAMAFSLGIELLNKRRSKRLHR